MSQSEFVVVSAGRVVFEGTLQECGDFSAAHPESVVFERSRTAGVATAQVATIDGPRLPKRSLLGLCTVTIPRDAAFRPKGPDVSFTESITNMPVSELERFAIMLNASEWSARKRVWAAITENGSLVLLPCLPEQRPTDPAAFPVGTRILEKNEAKVIAFNENRERLAVALIPREWTVPIRSMAPFAA